MNNIKRSRLLIFLKQIGVAKATLLFLLQTETLKQILLMNKLNLLKIGTILMLLVTMTSCNKEKKALKSQSLEIDSLKLTTFFQEFPEFKDYKKDIDTLYKKYDYKYIWYDRDGRNEFAEVLYDRARKIGFEGVAGKLPYEDKFQEIFTKDKKLADVTTDLLISSMYFFYADKVFEGVDPRKSKQMGWYLPRTKISFVDYLDELMEDKDLLNKDEDKQYSMYYNLRTALNRYRKIRDNGGWAKIELPEGVKSIKPGDDLPAVAQLRKRLAITGDINSDSGGTKYDDELVAAVKLWQNEHSLQEDGIVGPAVLSDLNTPVELRIKTILVNMERCRWINPDLEKNEEYILVNIPSYTMQYIKDGKTALKSNVVVGKELNKTVIFSGQMSYLVFSPYWNVPNSILEKEIQPAIERDPNYLDKHNMEWNGKGVRQKPGNNNSLGLVKFMFPNSNNIYLHDTPAKSLFSRDDRALSHGCVRVERAKDLANKILENDKNWNPSKIDEAMNAGTESSYSLKRKIPVNIAYFTAVASANGQVRFYDDVYKRDEKLAQLLYNE